MESSPMERMTSCCFSLLGLQISYPKIFRFLVQDIHFVDWEPGMAEKTQCQP